MAAPSVVYIESMQANGGSVSLPNANTVSTAVAGDLCVIAFPGIASSTPQQQLITYTSGGANANFTTTDAGSQPLQVDSGGGDGRIFVAWKRLVSGDFSGSNLKQFTVAGAGSYGLTAPDRPQIWIFHHASGWDSTMFSAYTDTAGFTVNVDQTLNGSGAPSRANVSLFVWSNPTAQSTLTIKWDGGTARAPYIDESSSTTTTGGHSSHYGSGNGQLQADYNEYDTGSGATAFQINAGASSSHAVLVYTFQTATNTVNGTASFSGGGTFAASGTPTVNGTAAFSGAGTFSATGTPTVSGTATFAGGGTFAASQAGVTTVNGTAVFSGDGAFTARQAIRGTATFDGGGSFSTAGTRTTTGTATFSGGGTFTTVQQTITTVTPAGGTWSSSVGLILGGSTVTGTASFSGGGSFAATGQKLGTHNGLGQFIGGGTFHATGTRVVVGTADLSADLVMVAVQKKRGRAKHATLNQKSRGTADQKTKATI